MNRDLRGRIDAAGGVATLADLRTVPRHVLDHAVRTRRLVRPFPRVYADPARLADPWTRIRAALGYAGPDAALSHLTALAVWQLPGGDLAGPVHVLVDWRRRRYATSGIVVHRRAGFVAEAPEVLVRRGVPTCRAERCVVDSWDLLPPDARRAAVIGAVGDRRTTPARLRTTLDASPSLVRFTHDQLVHRADEVRAQIRAIVMTRLQGRSGPARHPLSGPDPRSGPGHPTI